MIVMLDLSPKLAKIPFTLMSTCTLVRYIKNIADKTEFCKVAIIGSQGTGKTNIAIDVAHLFSKITRETCLIVYARGRYIIDMLLDTDLLKDILAQYTNDKKYIMFILDDFSYTLDLDRQKKKVVLHSYTKLRHVFPTKKLITIMTIHYRKSVVPLLRDVYFTVYTHMTPEMLIDFKDNYKLNVYARNYMRYMRYFYLESKGFMLNALYNTDEFVLKQIADDIHIVENINYNMKEQQQQQKNNTNILIRSSNERLGLVVSWSDTEYLYYRILYNEHGRFSLGSTDIIVIGKDDERIDLDKSRIIDISRYLETDNAIERRVVDIEDDDYIIEGNKKRNELDDLNIVSALLRSYAAEEEDTESRKPAYRYDMAQILSTYGIREEKRKRKARIDVKIEYDKKGGGGGKK